METTTEEIIDEVKPVKVGDVAVCSECLQEKTIVHLYGGKHPHCQQCDNDIRN